MKLLDQILDRETRARALECAILSRLLLDPRSLDGYGQIELSDEAQFIASVIANHPSTASRGLLSSVEHAITIDAGPTNPSELNVARYARIEDMARDVDRLPVGEVALAGALLDVVLLLGSVRADDAVLVARQRRRAA